MCTVPVTQDQMRPSVPMRKLYQSLCAMHTSNIEPSASEAKG
jgi:hypothetical protein